MPIRRGGEKMSLKEDYKKKEEELKAKWHDVIVKIAEKNGVDMGVGYDMLRATARGGDYAEGIEFDREDFNNDYFDLMLIGNELAKEEGLL